MPLEDCYTALQWLARQPDIDPARIAIGGQSAGAGLAAALALLAKERGKIRPVLQLLSYPMLDDRTTIRTESDSVGAWERFADAKRRWRAGARAQRDGDDAAAERDGDEKGGQRAHRGRGEHLPETPPEASAS